MQQWSSKCGKIHWRVVLVSAAASNKSTTRPPLPPPACGGEWKEIDRNRWVGIGQFNRTANKGKRNNNDTEKEKTQQNRPHNRAALPNRCRCTLPSREWVPAAPSPPPEPSMMAHGVEYPALFGQVGVGSAHPAVPLPGFWWKLTLSWPNPQHFTT